jgi:ribonuclease-3
MGSVIRNILIQIRLFFHPKKESYFILREILGFFPSNIEYYEEALCHKSIHGIRNHHNRISNERLEFLGDGVLNSIIADIVFKKYPARREGFLSQIRSKIVKREMMDRIAFELGLDKFIVSSAALKIQIRNNHISGNALEAFIGAIYLDRGYRLAFRFIEKKILKACVDIDEIEVKDQNYKSKMLEWSQKHKVALSYVTEEQKIDEQHNHIFSSCLLLDNKASGTGTGLSKKAAEQAAARQAFANLK